MPILCVDQFPTGLNLLHGGHMHCFFAMCGGLFALKHWLEEGAPNHHWYHFAMWINWLPDLMFSVTSETKICDFSYNTQSLQNCHLCEKGTSSEVRATVINVRNYLVVEKSEYDRWLVRFSLFIDLGFRWDLGRGLWGALGTFMKSRLIMQGSDWWKFSIWNDVIGS